MYFAAHEIFVCYKNTLPPDSPPNVRDPVFASPVCSLHTRSKGSGDVDDALEEVVPTRFFEVSKDLECAVTQGGFKSYCKLCLVEIK